MNIIDIALRRPISLMIGLIALILGSAFAFSQMPRDIFPSLDVPVIYVAQPYGGMSPAQMEGYLTYYYEYNFLFISGIDHIESKSIQSASLLKLQFRPGTNMAQAMAETIAYVNRAQALMPAGTVPPFILRFDAGSVPVGNLVFSSSTRPLNEIQDAALNRVRPLLATLPGVSAPPPFGGSSRSIVIHVNPQELHSYQLSLNDVVQALVSTNTLAPAGNVKIGDLSPIVPSNSTVSDIKELMDVPIRTGSSRTVFIGDVGTVEDGSDIPTGYALENGQRTVYIPVTKRSDASTLSVVNLVKANMSRFQSYLPEGINVSYQFDQSPHVTGAINNLIVESILGALLSGLMVLLFLKDWRSALIVVINIPLALMSAVLALWLTGETINIMTLGGLALAVGILVDEVTVTIENIHSHLDLGEPLARAALNGASETAVPTMLAVLCILAVFTPALIMTGATKSLFMPLSLSVGFSMIASLILANTLVPVLSVWILKSHLPKHADINEGAFSRFVAWFQGSLKRVMVYRKQIIGCYLGLTFLITAFFGLHLGKEIFPKDDSGLFQIRIHAPAGTRISKTEEITKETLQVVKDLAGSKNVDDSLAFIGVPSPSYPINSIYLWSSGPQEAMLQIQLNENAHISEEQLEEKLRHWLAQVLPTVNFSFQPGDIVSQVMSFGSPTPITIDVNGPSIKEDRGFADRIVEQLRKIPSLRDILPAQELDYPTVNVSIDRRRAGMLGVTTKDVTQALTAATSSSRFTARNFWADPKSGITYQVQVEVPDTQMQSVEDMQNIPVTAANGSSMLLRDVATVTPGTMVGEFDRYNSQRMVSINANIYHSDLGTVLPAVRAAIARAGTPPARIEVNVRGQIPALESVLESLEVGFLIAVGAIYLLLAAYFQSFRVPLIVISTVPAVCAGVVLMLWATASTLNLESFIGAIMAIGVAVANAILLATFAERNRIQGMSALDAMLLAAKSRLRPILMTGLAMLAGMTPMAIGLGEGGQQTAPLGRAVVGGLMLATVATLFLLPVVFVAMQENIGRESVSLSPNDIDSRHVFLDPNSEHPFQG